MNTEIKSQIEELYNSGTAVSSWTKNQIELVHHTVDQLDRGLIRVAEPLGSHQWQINTWVKQAILLFFRMRDLSVMSAGDFQYWDKIPVKKFSKDLGVRAVPHALARFGSHLESGVILMPSYVNIGAYVGAGTMVDTWATVGSCAQIGRNVHLSGGVGIGGVLEPLQAQPVIIEDDVFVGSRSIVVEGALIEEGAVLGAGVVITGSTKIIDVTQEEPQYYQGRVPTRAVVIPGTYNKAFPSGDYGVPCALIIGTRKASTDLKTSLTSALREYNVPV